MIILAQMPIRFFCNQFYKGLQECKVEREYKLMDRLRKEAKAAQRSNITNRKK